MLGLLLDQQISRDVAEQVRSTRPDIPILSLYEWREGALLGRADHLVLQAAAGEGLTLVTYDRKTIPPILVEWGMAGTAHGGVLFVDNFTIASNDFGRLVRGLIHYWEREHAHDWTNRVGFLPG